MIGKKVLILKLGAMGDVVRTTCILNALKKKYKNCEITWVTLFESMPILKNNPFIDEVVVYSKNLCEKFRRKFDVVISLEDDFEVCNLATLAGEKIYGNYVKDGKIIPSSSAKEWFDMSILGERPQNDILKRKNKKTYQEHLFKICELEQKYYDPILELSKKQKSFAKDFARRYSINSNEMVIGLNTGGGDRWPKDWSIENTSKLAELLCNKLKAKIILFGGPNEIERNNKILALAKVPIISTGCGNNLFEFPALVSLCDLVVTTDSLGLHIALALKRKVVVLFGPTSSNEIDAYGLGIKLKSKKECKCFYKTKCSQKTRCIDTVKPAEVFENVKKLINPRICVVISSFKEPHLENALKALMEQKTKYKFDVIVSAADGISEKIASRFRGVKIIKDPGKGKSFALNILFKKLDYDLMLFSDADVVLDENAVEEMIKVFKNPLIGCVGGRPVAMNKKDNKLGYWANFLYDVGAHEISRKKRAEKGEFFECSGYLFGFRKGIIDQIPLDVAEDSYIPYIFVKRRYKLGYAENAKVYVMNPDNTQDWIKQRVRTAKAHETLTKYAPDFPRVKSFLKEVLEGAFMHPIKIWGYPKNIKELFWTFELFFFRLSMWGKVFFDTKLKKKHYSDGWDRVESTKPKA